MMLQILCCIKFFGQTVCSILVTREEARLLFFPPYSNMADGDHLRANELEAFRNIREILLNVT